MTYTVRDAKSLIETTYPKLCTRFNMAFHAYSDATPLSDAITDIERDVYAWLKSMPDNFKTSNHALSRPKYGVVFILKNEHVRTVLGAPRCSEAIDAIESAWEECKRNLVVQMKDCCRTSDSSSEYTDTFYKSSLVALVEKHYDSTISKIVEKLLEGRYEAGAGDARC